MGRDSSAGIATGCGLDGLGIEFRWKRDYLHPSRPVLGPTHSPHNEQQAVPWGKERSGRDADPSPTSSAAVMEE